MRLNVKFVESDPHKGKLTTRDDFEIDVDPSDCLHSTMEALLRRRLDTSLDFIRIIFAGKLLTGPAYAPKSSFADHNLSKESPLHVLAGRSGFEEGDGGWSGPFGLCCHLDD